MANVKEKHMYKVNGVFEFEGVKFQDVSKVFTLNFSDATEIEIDVVVQQGDSKVAIDMATHELEKMVDLESGQKYDEKILV